MKKLSIVPALIIGAMGLSGCGGSSSVVDGNLSNTQIPSGVTTQPQESTLGETPPTATSGTTTLSGTCVTNYTNRTMITYDMLAGKTIYSSVGGEYDAIKSTFAKNEFVSEGKIIRTYTTRTINDEADGVDQDELVTVEDSYEIVNGGILLHRIDSKTWLLTLSKIEDNGDWTMLNQEITNNTCPATTNMDTWFFTLPPYYPEEIE